MREQLEKQEILCLLLDKEACLFIAVLDETLGHTEVRRSSKDVFGMPFELIEDGHLFIFEFIAYKGAIENRVIPASISKYLEVINSSILMKGLSSEIQSEYSSTSKYYHIVDNLPKIAESLRDNKINDILG